MWELFGVYITLFLLILILFILWIVWPRRQPIFRKWTLRTLGLTFLIALVSGLVAYWPREFEGFGMSDDNIVMI